MVVSAPRAIGDKDPASGESLWDLLEAAGVEVQLLVESPLLGDALALALVPAEEE